MKITVEQMQPVSRAGAELLRFINAILGYCEVLKNVRPKREKAAKLEKLFIQVRKHLCLIFFQNACMFVLFIQ